MRPMKVTLHCEVVVEGSLATVEADIDTLLWLTADPDTLNQLVSHLRDELHHTVTERYGEGYREACGAAPVWVERPGLCTVEILGGPHDGERIELNSDKPPLTVIMPGRVSLLEEDDAVIPVTMYTQVRDQHGFSRRTHDGAWLYGP